MNYGRAWNRLTVVLIVVWVAFCLFGMLSGDGQLNDRGMLFLVVGAGLIFAVMKTIAWIASGLFQSSQD